MDSVIPIPLETYKLGIIGAGKMTESIARGVVHSGVLPASRISTSHSNPTRRAMFESLGVKVLHQNHDVVEESDVVFSVKPQVSIVHIPAFVKDVVLQLKPLLTKKKLLVSVAAGVRLKDLQGGMKRHGFKGMPASHGASLSHRSISSTGQRDDPGKVFKGKKMPGRMGAAQRTVKNVWVYKTDPARNLMFVRGQVPGAEGNFVFIKDVVYKKPDSCNTTIPNLFWFRR